MFDVFIIGGGLAGLINAIRLAKTGLKVGLAEKNTYPFHRVCGEYISNETLPFLQSLDINPLDFGAVQINRFRLTSPKGKILEMTLDLGGFGISRYTLDNHLFQKAEHSGASIFQKTQIIDIQSTTKDKILKTSSGEEFTARTVISAHGKRATIDSALNRAFFKKRSPFIGVKYHLRLPESMQLMYSQDWITLHNFQDGYCGISRIEEDKYCLCYLTTRQNLKNQHTIPQLEQNVLAKNPHLKAIFDSAERLYDQPKVINEVSFASKPLIEQDMLMCGDSAGMIAPLCGNGMAMAIHSAKILSDLLILHFEGSLSKVALEKEYQKQWKKLFARRLWVGRQVQSMFGNVQMTELFLKITQSIAPLRHWLVRNSHGKVF